MRQIRLQSILDRQIIPLPDEYQMNVAEVYLVPDGISLLVIPANRDGTKLLDDRRHAFFSDPARMEKMRAFAADEFPPDSPADEPTGRELQFPVRLSPPPED
jgi:hypothetical protein